MEFASMGHDVWLVRHGQYDTRSGHLTETGKHEAANARDTLLSQDLAGRAIVLSSQADRTLETAQIIAGGLGADVIPSPMITTAGYHPAVVDRLGTYLDASLSAAGVHPQPNSPLVIVTHSPFIAAVNKLPETGDDAPREGSVYHCPESWTNPSYSPFVAQAFLGL